MALKPDNSTRRYAIARTGVRNRCEFTGEVGTTLVAKKGALVLLNNG
jgi:hypothetical protein